MEKDYTADRPVDRNSDNRSQSDQDSSAHNPDDHGSGMYAPTRLFKNSARTEIDSATPETHERQMRHAVRERHKSRIIGSSAAAQALRETIELYANDTSPVLITGETGVGKELVARELHRFSPRRYEEFVPVNASAIPESLAGSELFGHTKGAFTGAHADRDGAFTMANGGVLFLDEIGDMSPLIQTQILRVLDDGLVTKIGARTGAVSDVRLITATNIDLDKGIANENFRKDLFFRINVLPVHVPPLRDRIGDAIEIAEDQIRNHPNPDYRVAAITPRASERLLAHNFPGNVRELRNIIQRALVHARGGAILPEHLSFGCTSEFSANKECDVATARDLIGRLLVVKALAQTDGNVSKAAEITGMTRSSFYNVKKLLNGADPVVESAKLRERLRHLLET